MAVFDNDRGRGTYVSDNGVSYNFHVLNDYGTQAALGWTAGAEGQGPPPRGLSPRSWIVVTAGNKVVRVPVATNAAYVAGVIGTTSINVNVDGTSTAATLRWKEGERSRGEFHVDVPLPA